MKKILLLFIILNFLISCTSIKDGLTGTKRNNSDEFLIEKKNPLVQPPEYGKLPTPELEEENLNNSDQNKIEDLLKRSKSSPKNVSSNSSSVEEFILEKIKNK